MNRLVVIKGRERLHIGVLEKFEDLPIDKQNNFKKIKEVIEQIMNCKLQAYIFGSYNHGFWDEESDYDVSLVGSSKVSLDKLVEQRTGLKVNMFFTENKLGNVLIP